MERPCPYWPDDRQCASKECGIQHCDDEVPIALRKKSSIIPAVGLIRENNRTRARVCRKFKITFRVLQTSYLNCPSYLHFPIFLFISLLTINFQSNEDSESAESSKSDCETSNQFDPLDTSLSEYDRAQLRDMDIFEDTSNRFCDVEGEIFYLLFLTFLDEDSEDMHYVNLMKNPERYTGYKGNSATKIWQAIYQENCFKYVL